MVIREPVIWTSVTILSKHAKTCRAKRILVFFSPTVGPPAPRRAAALMGKSLPPAPRLLSGVSLLLYLAVWFGALGATLSWVPNLTAVMCAIYGTESVLALVFGISTLKSWRNIDYILHHVPYAIVVGSSILFGLPIFEHYRYTMPLTLLTSINEATAAAYSLGAPRSIERPNRAFLLLLMLVLIVTEVYETGACLLTPGGPGKLMGLVAVSSLAAPAYHAIGVVPCCWKRLLDGPLKSTEFEPDPRVDKSR